MPESYPLAPFAAGCRRVTSLSKKWALPPLAVPFCLSLFSRSLVRAFGFLPSCFLARCSLPSSPFLPIVSISLFPSRFCFSPFCLALSFYLSLVFAAFFHFLASVLTNSSPSPFLSCVSDNFFFPLTFERSRPRSPYSLLFLYSSYLSSASSIVTYTPTFPVAGWPSLACRRRRR